MTLFRMVPLAAPGARGLISRCRHRCIGQRAAGTVVASIRPGLPPLGWRCRPPGAICPNGARSAARPGPGPASQGAVRPLSEIAPLRTHRGRKLLDGVSPGRLAGIHVAVAESSKLLDVVAEHGLVVGAEVNPLPNLWQMAVGAVESARGKKTEGNPFMPRVQVTLIVPGAAADAAAILNTLQLLDADKSFELKEQTIAGRKLLHAKNETVHVMAWVEGPHVVVVIGTEPPAAVLARIDGKEPRLDSHPLYKKLQADGGFRTDVLPSWMSNRWSTSCSGLSR